MAKLGKKKLIGVKKRHGDGNYESRAIIKRKPVHVGTFAKPTEAALARDLFIINSGVDLKLFRLNDEKLRGMAKSKLPAMPTPTGTVHNGKTRQPRANSGYKYIHESTNGFVFRQAVATGRKRKYVRKSFMTLDAALIARKVITGIPIDRRA